MENWQKAFNDRKNGLRYKEIADKYNVSLNTVKSWKRRYWDKKEPQKVCAKEVHTKNRGGAPLQNKNNFKHGLYEKIYWDSIDGDEKALIDSLDFFDEQELIKEQIKLLTIRERRLMRRIDSCKDSIEALYSSSSERNTTIRGNINQTQSEIITNKASVFDIIERLETELTRVQARKTKCIETLHLIKTKNSESGRKIDISGDVTINISGEEY